MTSLVDDTHASMPKSLVQLISTVEDWLSRDRLSCGVTIIRTVVDVIRIAAPTNWAFFHLLVDPEAAVFGLARFAVPG
jgi:hypothetical protein